MSDDEPLRAESIKRAAEDPEAYLAWNLREARKGKDSSHARELLQAFLTAVDTRQPIPEAVKEYLAEAIGRHMSGGVDWDKALLLSAPAERPPGSFARNPVWAVAMLYLYMKRDKMTKTKAEAAMKEQHGVEPRTLQRYDEQHDLIRDMEVPRLEELVYTEMELAKK